MVGQKLRACIALGSEIGGVIALSRSVAGFSVRRSRADPQRRRFDIVVRGKILMGQNYGHNFQADRTSGEARVNNVSSISVLKLISHDIFPW